METKCLPSLLVKLSHSDQANTRFEERHIFGSSLLLKEQQSINQAHAAVSLGVFILSSIVDADGSKLAPDSASPFITAVRRPGKRSQREGQKGRRQPAPGLARGRGNCGQVGGQVEGGVEGGVGSKQEGSTSAARSR